MTITLRRAAEAVHRAELNLRGLVESLEDNPRRAKLPDVSLRRSHADELAATASLLYRLAPHAAAIKNILGDNE